MKKLIIIGLLGLSALAYGQTPLDVAIIGTVYQFKSEYQALQSFDEAQDFITDFSPDIICIESIPIEDTLSLREVLSRELDKADRLRDTLTDHGAFSIASQQLATISSFTGKKALLESCRENPQLLKGAQYYATYDFWNAFYEWDDIQQNGGQLGYFSDYIWKLDKTEFRHIIFPVARQLGVKKLYGIDYRLGEAIFLNNNQKVFKQLFFKLKWKPLRIYLKTQKRYKKAEKKGTLITYINSPTFQDAFSKLIETLHKRLPKSKEAEDIQRYWLKRNEIMASRLIDVAQQQGAKKVLLAIGSAHVSYIQHFLEARGHTVHTYHTSTSSSKKH